MRRHHVDERAPLHAERGRDHQLPAGEPAEHPGHDLLGRTVVADGVVRFPHDVHRPLPCCRTVYPENEKARREYLRASSALTGVIGAPLGRPVGLGTGHTTTRHGGGLKRRGPDGALHNHTVRLARGGRVVNRSARSARLAAASSVAGYPASPCSSVAGPTGIDFGCRQGHREPRRPIEIVPLEPDPADTGEGSAARPRAPASSAAPPSPVSWSASMATALPVPARPRPAAPPPSSPTGTAFPNSTKVYVDGPRGDPRPHARDRALAAASRRSGSTTPAARRGTTCATGCRPLAPPVDRRRLGRSRTPAGATGGDPSIGAATASAATVLRGTRPGHPAPVTPGAARSPRRWSSSRCARAAGGAGARARSRAAARSSPPTSTTPSSSR